VCYQFEFYIRDSQGRGDSEKASEVVFERFLMKARVLYAVRIANGNRRTTRSPSDEGHKVWA
jgi:hypothetical protein